MHGEAGKGYQRRPRQTGNEEHELRLKLADGDISHEEFDREYFKLFKAGKITRGGRVVK